MSFRFNGLTPNQKAAEICSFATERFNRFDRKPGYVFRPGLVNSRTIGLDHNNRPTAEFLYEPTPDCPVPVIEGWTVLSDTI